MTLRLNPVQSNATKKHPILMAVFASNLQGWFLVASECTQRLILIRLPISWELKNSQFQRFLMTLPIDAYLVLIDQSESC